MMRISNEENLISPDVFLSENTEFCATYENMLAFPKKAADRAVLRLLIKSQSAQSLTKTETNTTWHLEASIS